MTRASLGRVLRTGLLGRAGAVLHRIRHNGEHPSRVKPTGTTLTLTNYGVSQVFDEGERIRIYGWAWGQRPIDGDYLILRQGNGTTRYLAINVTYPGNPHDMFFADCEFAPR